MGSLATHFSTFMFLFPIGVRRLHSSLSLFLKEPTHYRSKPWFFFEPKWKNLDFYALLIALPIASFSEFILFLSFSGHPTYRFSFLQHGLVFFLFWVVLILLFLRESFDIYSFNESFVYVLAGISFIVEFLFEGNGFAGVSSIVYELLSNLTLVCAFCCLYLSIKPTSFLADFFLSSGLIFKGTWVLQVGLNLYTDTFGLKGCHAVSLLSDQDKVDIKCDLEEDSLRGIALMNFLFVGHAILVLMICLGLFGLLSRNKDLRCSDYDGPLLARIETHAMLMQSLPEFEIE